MEKRCRGWMVSFCCAVKEYTKGPRNVGWESVCAALGSLGLARDQRKVGDCFGEVGERAALDQGDVPKPRAAQRRACFILPTSSWQDISCFVGKSAVLLDIQPRFASRVTGPTINERWSRDPIPAGTEPRSPSGPELGFGLGWTKRGHCRKIKTHVKKQRMLVNVGLCLQRGLLHCPRQQKGASAAS